MKNNIGNISQGLGNFTPDVWKRLGETILDLEGQTEPNSKNETARPELPVQFLAKIVKAELIGSGTAGLVCYPRRVYRYWFEQVGLRFTIDGGPVMVDMPGGIKTSATNGLYAINGAELDVPQTRDDSVNGVMLNGNSYPDMTVVPTIHNAFTNTEGVTEQITIGSGPLVNISLIDCVQSSGTSLPMVGYFYSAITLDGGCESECI